MASPAPQQHEHLLRQVTMDSNNNANTPGKMNTAMISQPNNAPPEPSPNKSAAAFALSLLCQDDKQRVPPPPTTVPNPIAPLAAFQAQQQQPPMHPHPTPSYPPPPQAWNYQYPVGNTPNESPFPVKRLKVSHAEVVKNVRQQQHQATQTPRAYQAGMRLPTQKQQYVPSPFAPYQQQQQQGVTPYAPPAKNNGMPQASSYGQVRFVNDCLCIYLYRTNTTIVITQHRLPTLLLLLALLLLPILVIPW